VRALIDLAQEYASLVTAVGVIVATTQLWLSRSSAQSSFEDSLAKEYRELIRLVPVDVLLGREFDRELAGSNYNAVRELIFNYLDLTNEQVFLRKKRRVRKSTWHEWADGIRTNLRLPLFKSVWDEIKKESPEMFSELRELERSGFERDPWCWYR